MAIRLFAVFCWPFQLLLILYQRHTLFQATQSIKNAQFKPKIIIIGGGLSGICTAVKLKHEMGYDNFIVLERNDSVGGTWYTNTYPGCACDIPAHFYSYSFDQKYNWTQEYPKQPEILQYIKNTTNKYGIYQHIKFKLIQCKCYTNNL